MIAKMSFQTTGFKMPGLVTARKIFRVIILRLMLVSHYGFGKKKGGYMMMIHGAGFNGTVGTIWGGELSTKMIVKLSAGVQCDAMLLKW
jgi:hypothetical protein